MDGYEPSLCKSCYDFKRIHLKWKDLKSASKVRLCERILGLHAYPAAAALLPSPMFACGLRGLLRAKG